MAENDAARSDIIVQAWHPGGGEWAVARRSPDARRR
jgi:hypothetical protein